MKNGNGKYLTIGLTISGIVMGWIIATIKADAGVDAKISALKDNVVSLEQYRNDEEDLKNNISEIKEALSRIENNLNDIEKKVGKID